LRFVPASLSNFNFLASLRIQKGIPMTETIPTIIAPAFAVFEDRRSKTPIFLAAGLKTESDSPFRQACAFAQGYNGQQGSGKAIIRRASARVIFGAVTNQIPNC
jgi:hypothetical protein